jgi:hypothetical protein
VKEILPEVEPAETKADAEPAPVSAPPTKPSPAPPAPPSPAPAVTVAVAPAQPLARTAPSSSKLTYALLAAAAIVAAVVYALLHS